MTIEQPISRRSATAVEPVVFQEDAGAREHLLNRIHQSGEIADEHVVWISLDQIEQDSVGPQEFEKSLATDIVIIAASARSEFSPQVRSWLESWALKRRHREGVLIGLFHDRHPSEVSSIKEIYLRQIARFAGLDYLNELPACTHARVPDSIDSFSARAGQMTSVLDCILKTRIPPAPPR